MCSSSERKYGRALGPILIVCAHVCTLCSHKGASLRGIRYVRVYGWMVVGQPSSSVVIGMSLSSAIDIGFPDQISGPPKGYKSAAISVAMLRAMMEGQIGVPPLRAWNASSSGQILNLVAA
jgi:hypothetical protein